MKKCKAFIVFILVCKFSICDAQQTDAKFHLEKLIYHASRCNGSCPEINIEIEKNKKIYVTRQIFKSKSEIDLGQSGTFIGRLKKTEYNKLISLLKANNLDSLQFPISDCCDGSIKTLIVYYNGQRRYFKSMQPPDSTGDLFNLLKEIATNKKLKLTKINKMIEE